MVTQFAVQDKQDFCIIPFLLQRQEDEEGEMPGGGTFSGQSARSTFKYTRGGLLLAGSVAREEKGCRHCWCRGGDRLKKAARGPQLVEWLEVFRAGESWTQFYGISSFCPVNPLCLLKNTSKVHYKHRPCVKIRGQTRNGPEFHLWVDT